MPSLGARRTENVLSVRLFRIVKRVKTVISWNSSVVLLFFQSVARWRTISCYLHGVRLFFKVRRKPRNGKLAKMGSFHQSMWSDNKQYAVEVRCGIFIENLTFFFNSLERS